MLFRSKFPGVDVTVYEVAAIGPGVKLTIAEFVVFPSTAVTPVGIDGKDAASASILLYFVPFLMVALEGLITPIVTQFRFQIRRMQRLHLMHILLQHLQRQVLHQE